MISWLNCFHLHANWFYLIIAIIRLSHLDHWSVRKVCMDSILGLYHQIGIIQHFHCRSVVLDCFIYFLCTIVCTSCTHTSFINIPIWLNCRHAVNTCNFVTIMTFSKSNEAQTTRIGEKVLWKKSFPCRDRVEKSTETIKTDMKTRKAAKPIQNVGGEEKQKEYPTLVQHT